MDQLMIGSLIIGSTVRSTNTQCVYDQLGSTWIPHESSTRWDLDRRSTQRQVAFFDLAKDYAFEPLGEGWSGDDRMVDVKKGRWFSASHMGRGSRHSGWWKNILYLEILETVCLSLFSNPRHGMMIPNDDHIFQGGGSTTNQIWESTNYPIKGHVYSNGIGLQHVPRNKGTPKAQNTNFIGTHVSLQANEFQLEVGNVPNEIGTGMETSTYHLVIKDGFPENHKFIVDFPIKNI